MNRVLVLAIIGAILGGSVAVVIAVAGDGEGPIFITTNGPVTEVQVREKLQSQGWTNIHIVNEGRYFEAIGLKDGKTNKIAVDAISGRLMTGDDDGDGD
jgi:hypothetical protein